MRVLLLALCACNQVFGLDRTHLALPDGTAKPDPMCPTSGPPEFGVSSRVVFSLSCSAYSPAETVDLALASCGGDIFGGPVDSDMPSILMLPTNTGDYLRDARLGPEGDRVIVTRADSSARAQAYELYRSDSGVWSHVSTLPFTPSVAPTVGIPSRFAPGAHVVVDEADGLHELVDDGSGTWPERHFYAPDVLTGDGSAMVGMASLTPDGKRMVFHARLVGGCGAAGIWYAERPSIDVAFTLPARPIDVPGQVGTFFPYLTENCGKLYYSDLSTIYVVEQ